MKMMRKTLFFICMAILLNACSVGKHYFNKRIAHPHQDTEPEQVMEGTNENEKTLVPVTTTMEIKAEPMVLDSAPHAPAVEKPAQKGWAHTKVKVKPVQPLAKHATTHAPSIKNKLVVASDVDIDGFGIVLLVIVGVFLLVFLISLLLGYTAAQAALYGLMAILILLIIGLILLLRNDDDGDNGD